MKNLPDFRIESLDEISNQFLKKGILTFHPAANFIANLAYGRNANKEDLKSIFEDNCGTCSTKHALLKMLADENGFNEIKLFLGLFKMNAVNTPGISQTLKKNKLEYIPEAHNYLKFESQIYDFTRPNSKASDFENDLIFEIEIAPTQISNYKVQLHREYLQNWLGTNPKIEFDLEGIWKIREECIQDLSNY